MRDCLLTHVMQGIKKMVVLIFTKLFYPRCPRKPFTKLNNGLTNISKSGLLMIHAIKRTVLEKCEQIELAKKGTRPSM